MPESDKAAEKELARLRKMPENRVCPNCLKEDSLGFHAVCMAFKTFICSECKSAHQSFSHRTKSVNQSIWTMEEVKVLDPKRGGGNKAALSYWLARVPDGERPTADSPLDKYKKFIERAYIEKRWIGDAEPAADGGASAASESPEASTCLTWRSRPASGRSGRSGATGTTGTSTAGLDEQDAEALERRERRHREREERRRERRERRQTQAMDATSSSPPFTPEVVGAWAGGEMWSQNPGRLQPYPGSGFEGLGLGVAGGVPSYGGSCGSDCGTNGSPVEPYMDAAWNYPPAPGHVDTVPGSFGARCQGYPSPDDLQSCYAHSPAVHSLRCTSPSDNTTNPWTRGAESYADLFVRAATDAKVCPQTMGAGRSPFPSSVTLSVVQPEALAAALATNPWGAELARVVEDTKTNPWARDANPIAEFFVSESATTKARYGSTLQQPPPRITVCR